MRRLILVAGLAVLCPMLWSAPARRGGCGASGPRIPSRGWGRGGAERQRAAVGLVVETALGEHDPPRLGCATGPQSAIEIERQLPVTRRRTVATDGNPHPSGDPAGRCGSIRVRSAGSAACHPSPPTSLSGTPRTRGSRRGRSGGWRAPPGTLPHRVGPDRVWRVGRGVDQEVDLPAPGQDGDPVARGEVVEEVVRIIAGSRGGCAAGASGPRRLRRVALRPSSPVRQGRVGDRGEQECRSITPAPSWPACRAPPS